MIPHHRDHDLAREREVFRIEAPRDDEGIFDQGEAFFDEEFIDDPLAADLFGDAIEAALHERAAFVCIDDHMALAELIAVGIGALQLKMGRGEEAVAEALPLRSKPSELKRDELAIKERDEMMER